MSPPYNINNFRLVNTCNKCMDALIVYISKPNTFSYPVAAYSFIEKPDLGGESLIADRPCQK